MDSSLIDYRIALDFDQVLHPDTSYIARPGIQDYA